MTSEWHYSRDGKDSGPVSSAELRQLAASGKLLRTDLLWKEGMADWKPAAQFPKLFPDEKPASAIIADEAGEDPLESFKLDVDPVVKKSAKAKAPTSVTDNLASLQVDVAAAGRKATSQVKSHARTAGKVAVLAAERTKISTVTLPFAYAELGEHCYRSRTHAEEFADLFAKLDAVQAGIAESGKPAEAGGDTIAEKAKAWAEQGMKFAQSQAQGVQAKTLFVQLGKACFNRFGPEAGPEELVTRIQALRDRLSKLDSEVKTGVNKTGGAKGWLMYGGGALVCLMMISSCFSERDPGRGGGGGGGGSAKGVAGESGSRGFKGVVDKLRQEGFLIKKAGLENGGGHSATLVNAVVCHKSNGEDDAVVCVAEYEPIAERELNVGEPNEHVVARRELLTRVVFMHAMLSRLDQEILDKLSWLDTGNGRRLHKDTTNGTTEFVGILLIGSEKALVSWPQDLRWFPENEIWRVEYEDQLLMFGNDDIGNSRPSTTRLIQALMTGGR